MTFQTHSSVLQFSHSRFKSQSWSLKYWWWFGFNMFLRRSLKLHTHSLLTKPILLLNLWWFKAFAFALLKDDVKTGCKINLRFHETQAFSYAISSRKRQVQSEFKVRVSHQSFPDEGNSKIGQNFNRNGKSDLQSSMLQIEEMSLFLQNSLH